MLIVEFLFDFDDNAVLQGQGIGRDAQAFVGLDRGDEILPCFEGVQPVVTRSVDLRNVIDGNGGIRVDLVGVDLAGVLPKVAVLVRLRRDIQAFERAQVFLEGGIEQGDMLDRNGIRAHLPEDRGLALAALRACVYRSMTVCRVSASASVRRFW